MTRIHLQRSYIHSTFNLVAVAFILPIAFVSTVASATTTIDVPPDPAPISITGDTVLNLSDGGALPDNFVAFTGSTVNIQGGIVGNNFSINGTGTTVNISGGNMGDDFHPGIATVSGGVFGDGITLGGGVLLGSDFELNGLPISGLTQIGDSVPLPSYTADSVLSGTFANGTPFAFLFQGARFDDLGGASLQLTAPATPGPTQINLPVDATPAGIVGGQTLVMGTGANVPNNFVAGAGSILTMNGGAIGTNFRADGSQVTINGGSVGSGFKALIGSTVAFNGGVVGDNLVAIQGANVTLDGARVGSNVDLEANSNFKISGGTVGPGYMSNGGTTTLVGTNFKINGVPVSGLSQVGSTTTVNPLAAGAGIITGTLADGTPIVINRFADNFDASSRLVLQLSPPPATGPAVINLPSDPVPFAVNNGQTLNVNAGAVLPTSFRAGDSTTVNISGGSIGADFETVASNIHLSSGSIGDGFLPENSNITITGGTIGDNMFAGGTGTLKMTGGVIGSGAELGGMAFQLLGGSTGPYFVIGNANGTLAGTTIGDNSTFFAGALGGSTLTMTSGSIGNGFGLTGSSGNTQGPIPILNMYGGTIGNNIFVNNGALNLNAGSIGSGAEVFRGTLTIAGGTIGSGLSIQGPDSILNYSGGVIGPGLSLGAFSTMLITGDSFLLGGQPIPGLSHPGDSVVITKFNGSLLTGTVSDGTAFSFALNQFGGPGSDQFSLGATLRLTLAPEPSSVLLAALGGVGLVAAARGGRRSRSDIVE